MAAPLRILCVHGIGREGETATAENAWTDAIWDAVARVDPRGAIDIRFVHYLDLFERYPLTALDCLRATGKLLSSFVATTVGELFGTRSLARGDLTDTLRWTAGMVVQWVEHDALRRDARRRLAAAIDAADPQFVLGHSLGSLIAYDTFSHRDTSASARARTFVSFGSQIGNRFVVGSFGGRIEPLAKARAWHHLFNDEDACFTARLRVRAANFDQTDTPFDVAGMLDHDATEYLRHPATSRAVWARYVDPDPRRRQVLADLGRARSRAARRTADHRALVIGIDDYPDPADRLDGCVNDAYLLSAVLQESAFALGGGGSDEIRMLLNRRATAAAIRDRLAWLLEDARPGDVRVLHYSGHGSQLPGYGPDEQVDRLDECLVPWDFDWSRERAVLDDQFYELYSQLEYGVRFVVVLDCCHSGGMSRSGGPRARGITPPDDVRHRALRWNSARQLWQPREVAPLVRRGRFARRPTAATGGLRQYLGAAGNVRRLARAAELRAVDANRYDALRRDYDHHGPYLPVVLQACAESQLAFEYRDGATPHGAFSWALAEMLRKRPRRTLSTVAEALATRVRALGCEQDPQALFPSVYARRTIGGLFDRARR